MKNKGLIYGILGVFTFCIIFFSYNSSEPIGIPVTVSGTTNASGVFTYTFPNAYLTPPNVQASVTNQTNPNQQLRVSSVTTTGFTVNVYQRNAVTLLGIEVLLSATTPVSGATIDCLVTQK